ncbi:MAG TPA: hypothetical protein PLI01_00305 [Nitrospira sp.]|nr:hypothetical protein [Nitrospira sp.]HNA25200.1 hypothetical protein [Nitrospira sp.]HNI17490.1 hypothetical protein [Nitrospira sp.]
MSEELALGQREITVETQFDSLSAEEVTLLGRAAFSLVLDIVKGSGTQTLNAAIGELAGNADAGLDASAKPEAAATDKASTGETTEEAKTE